MALQPKCARYSGSIDAGLVPPHGFIPAAMHLAMMTTAERDRELIAPFSAQSRWLCKPEMMRIGGTATANKAWLFSDRFHMLPVTNSTRHGNAKTVLLTLITRFRRPRRLLGASACSAALGSSVIRAESLN
jgi:hypothetical protein